MLVNKYLKKMGTEKRYEFAPLRFLTFLTNVVLRRENKCGFGNTHVYFTVSRDLSRKSSYWTQKISVRDIRKKGNMSSS
jgi:hypothetical protein